jgi:protein-disulfide isomerase
MDNPDIVKLKRGVTELDHLAGPASAPVTLIEYGNFECLHCGRAYPTIKETRRLLGENLRFVFRHFPTVQTHPHALRAAEASEAAARQGRFWEMHDELFTHQQALEDTNLLRYAKKIGLDTAAFTRDMTEHTFLKQIESDYQRDLFEEHVTGTPTFYINEVRYSGGSDVASLLAAIKRADTEGRIKLPESNTGLRGLIGRLRRHVNN